MCAARVGSQWQNAMAIFHMMPQIGLFADAITYASVISALSKGRQWELALEVRNLFAKRNICCFLAAEIKESGSFVSHAEG